jgi:signal transduction histidine kinase
VLRPIRSITQTAAEIQATDLSRRIRLRGPRDELSGLADTIDSMLDRLDAAFRAQRQLIDDASHELRNPLAIIRTNVDAVLTSPNSSEEERRTAAGVVDRATTRMTHLVEDLLATSRRSAPAFRDTEVDLTEIAREAAEEFVPLAAAGGLTIRRRLGAALPLIGDHDALRRAVGNLLSNAVRLSPPTAAITVAAGRLDGWSWIAVRDEGPGIHADDRPHVFDRFWRGGERGGEPPTVRDGEPAGRDRGAEPVAVRGRGGEPKARSRGGGEPGRGEPAGTDRRTGLGLAIVRQIVEAHGGWVGLFSEVGTGSTFVLWFRTGEHAPPTPPQRDPLAEAADPR